MAKLSIGSRRCKISDWQQEVKPRMEQFFGQGRNCPKKLAIRKKSTISRILTWNFGNQMATQKDSKSENLKKIQVLEPPQIDLRTEPKLVGTNGISRSRQFFSFTGNVSILTKRFSREDHRSETLKIYRTVIFWATEKYNICMESLWEKNKLEKGLGMVRSIHALLLPNNQFAGTFCWKSVLDRAA